MFLLTPSQSVSHKGFHQCVNHKKKLSWGILYQLLVVLAFSRHQFDSGSIRYFKNWQNLIKINSRHLFQCCILIPRKCPHKHLLQHTVGGGLGGGQIIPSIILLAFPDLQTFLALLCFLAADRRFSRSS